jgi:hypothetical protein
MPLVPGQGTAASGLTASIEANTRETDNVQAFAFLPARSNLPFLPLWTGNSAVRFSARVLEFNGMEYHDSGGWIEQYQYEDGEFSVHDVPRILKKSFPGEPPPECFLIGNVSSRQHPTRRPKGSQPRPLGALFVRDIVRF